MNKQLMAILILALSLSTAANAALIARDGGMVYDDVNNITWAADANLFQTQAAANSNLVSEIIAANGGVVHDTPNGWDNGTYTLTTADFNTSSGQMSWWGAQAWANNLTLGAYTGWTLPATPLEAGAYNINTSPMGDLFYNQLGGVQGSSITLTHNANYNLFSNVQGSVYWSSSELQYNPDAAWNYVTYEGYHDAYLKYRQLYAWAVRPGDVSAVPLPAAVWLFLSGLIGFMGLNHRLRKIDLSSPKNL